MGQLLDAFAIEAMAKHLKPHEIQDLIVRREAFFRVSLQLQWPP